MNTAQEHALEQANLVTQLIKYADRVILVESASAPERRAFVKLLADKLPDSIEILSLRTGGQSQASAIITLISDALQLSPGIESPRQLANAVHEAMEGQERLLMVIENADGWLDTPQWSGLLAILRAAHDLAPNQLLFLLTGDIGLTDQLRLAPELSDMQGDMHLCQLLGEAPPDAPAPIRPVHDEPIFAEAPEGAALVSDNEAPASRRKSSGPMLLVAAAISVAIITFGGFALLSSTQDKPAVPQTLALNTPPAEPVVTGTPPAQPGNPLPNDGGLSAASSLSGAAAHSAAASAPVAPAANHVPAVTPAPATAVEPPAPRVEKPAEVPAAPALIAPREKPPVEKITPKQPVEAPKHEQHVEKRPEKQQEKQPEKRTEQPVEKRIEKPSEKPATTAAVKSVDNAWYRARPKNRAALQLGAFNDEKAALAFIQKHRASTRLGDWHVFSQKRSNQVLYTVTLGDFATLGDARAALPTLSEPMRALKPYPRSFEAIDAVISAP